MIKSSRELPGAKMLRIFIVGLLPEIKLESTGGRGGGRKEFEESMLVEKYSKMELRLVPFNPSFGLLLSAPMGALTSRRSNQTEDACKRPGNNRGKPHVGSDTSEF